MDSAFLDLRGRLRVGAPRTGAKHRVSWERRIGFGLFLISGADYKSAVPGSGLDQAGILGRYPFAEHPGKIEGNFGGRITIVVTHPIKAATVFLQPFRVFRVVRGCLLFYNKKHENHEIRRMNNRRPSTRHHFLNQRTKKAFFVVSPTCSQHFLLFPGPTTSRRSQDRGQASCSPGAPNWIRPFLDFRGRLQVGGPRARVRPSGNSGPLPVR